MRTRVTQCNLLQQSIEAGLISSRARWQKAIEDADFDFPEISFDDLCFIFLSTYKIKLAPAYVEEHLNQEGDYIIELNDNSSNILRCTIQSRHSNSAKYKCWIQYSLSGDPINSWYCTCRSGAITIGACSHIVSIVWYLSYARHNNFTSSMGRRRIQQAISERTITEQDTLAESDQENDE